MYTAKKHIIFIILLLIGLIVIFYSIALDTPNFNVMQTILGELADGATTINQDYENYALFDKKTQTEYGMSDAENYDYYSIDETGSSILESHFVDLAILIYFLQYIFFALLTDFIVYLFKRWDNKPIVKLRLTKAAISLIQFANITLISYIFFSTFSKFVYFNLITFARWADKNNSYLFIFIFFALLASLLGLSEFYKIIFYVIVWKIILLATL